MKKYYPILKKILILLLYGIIAFILLSPLWPDDFCGDAIDISNHVAAIVQSKMAIDLGQFPLRTAPWQFNTWQYPVFQYYSNFPYLLAGYIYKYISPQNPYWAFKFLCWLSLVISAFFTYKFTKLFTPASRSSIIAGAVYMCAPYFLVNILARGAWTEVIAQGIIPVILYFSYRCFESPGIKFFAISSFAWFALATTHIITFIYSGIFTGLFFVLMVIIQWRVKNPRGIIKLGIGVIFGCLLAAFFLAPIIFRPNLNIELSFQNPYDGICVVSLANLISPVSYTPTGCSGTIGLSPNIGWPILLSWIFATYILFFRHSSIRKNRLYKSVFYSSYVIFCLSAFIVWSPFDFWSVLPKYFWVIQFTYRNLSHTMWSGAILFSLTTDIILQKYKIWFINIGLLIAVCISAISYLPTQKYIYPVSNIVERPDLGYGQATYLLNTRELNSDWIKGNSKLPIIFSDGWIIEDKYIPVSTEMINSFTNIKMSGLIPDFLEHGLTLYVWQDSEIIAEKYFPAGPFEWETPIPQVPENHAKDVYIKITSDQYFIPSEVDENSSDQRHLSVLITNIVINFNSSEDIMPVSETQNFCTLDGSGIICDFENIQQRIVQLPILYYPSDLVNGEINGQDVELMPIISQEFLLTGVNVSPGMNHIVIKFQGLPWANKISLICWLIFVLLLLMEIINDKLVGNTKNIATEHR